MTNAEDRLRDAVQKALQELYNIQVSDVPIQKTRKEFEGDFTLVTFAFAKTVRRSPEQLGQELGEKLKSTQTFISNYNVVKGFLNLLFSTEFWLEYFNNVRTEDRPGFAKPRSSGRKIMVEFASPNTNKPIHLGHVRNILLGYSLSKILEANGHEVIKSNLINDRGIHICKSMYAWLQEGNGETPESSKMKGDHLAGKYYVAFDRLYKKQQEELMAQGKSKEEAERSAPAMQAAQEMLRKWEAGDKETVQLWKTMNSWVYKGFDETFEKLGVTFDKVYYESDTYLLGKDVVQEGLAKKVFYRKENGSVAIDLSSEGLDEKIVLRSDGTSVYITQDIGTAIERFKEFPGLSQLIYTVGNEQDYHFKVLFSILDKLGYAWARECYHLSYGMVELPEGKMKSREGTVVDADDLLQQMYATAEETTRELGKVADFSDEELRELYSVISLGALKYFILKVEPRKKMLFNPKESIDFNGHTGPFIQYTHARIKSVLRRCDIDFSKQVVGVSLNVEERDVLRFIYDFASVVKEAASQYNPSLIANHLYELTKAFNRFYHEHSILNEADRQQKIFRLQLSQLTAKVLYCGMELLGVKVPERM